MPKVLNQVIAIEKGRKQLIHSELSKLHHACQKPELLNGFTKKYTPVDDADTERFADESKRVQLFAPEVLNVVQLMSTELFDIEATKDAANCLAKADVLVDGKPLLSGLPATTLLFLEKQLVDFRTFIEKMPVLDPSEDWTADKTLPMMFRSTSRKTHRTKKVVRPITLVEPTDKHPGQAQLISEDQVVGYYESTSLSGALAVPRKITLLQRVSDLIDSVKMAREQANTTPANDVKIGRAIFDFLLAQ